MEFSILYTINNLHSSILDKIMISITNLGNVGIIWIALAIILICKKKTRTCGILMLLAMGVGIILGNGILKNLVARDRPCWLDPNVQLLIPMPKDYSFPSGHTLASFEAAVIIFLHNKKWGIFAILLAILIGFSRMYLFVHFPTDVLGGAILGTVISILVYYIFEKIKRSKTDKKIIEKI